LKNSILDSRAIYNEKLYVNAASQGERKNQNYQRLEQDRNRIVVEKNVLFGGNQISTHFNALGECFVIVETQSLLYYCQIAMLKNQFCNCIDPLNGAKLKLIEKQSASEFNLQLFTTHLYHNEFNNSNLPSFLSMSSLKGRSAMFRHSIHSIESITPSTLYTNGCGISFIANISLNMEKISTGGACRDVDFTKAFVKIVQTEDNVHYESESHLREIMFATLDILLQTKCVLPTVGTILDLNFLSKFVDFNTLQSIKNNSQCIIGANEFSIPASITMWSATDLTSFTTSAENRPITLNFFRYVLLNFVGGCARSMHNAFTTKNDQDEYIALDNDRCLFTSNTFLSKSIPRTHIRRWLRWSNLLFGNKFCLFAQQNVEQIEPLIRSIWQLFDFHSNNLQNDSCENFISLFKSMLKRDPLAYFLLQTKDIIFSEICQRLQKFLNHFRFNCLINFSKK